MRPIPYSAFLSGMLFSACSFSPLVSPLGAFAAENPAERTEAMYDESFRALPGGIMNDPLMAEAVAGAVAIDEANRSVLKRNLDIARNAFQLFRAASRMPEAIWSRKDFDSLRRRLGQFVRMSDLLALQARLCLYEDLHEEALDALETLLRSAVHILSPLDQNSSLLETLNGFRTVDLVCETLRPYMEDDSVKEMARRLFADHPVFGDFSLAVQSHAADITGNAAELISIILELDDITEVLRDAERLLQLDSGALNAEVAINDLADQMAACAADRKNEWLEISGLPFQSTLERVEALQRADEARINQLGEAFRNGGPGMEPSRLLAEIVSLGSFLDLTLSVKMEMALREKMEAFAKGLPKMTD